MNIVMCAPRERLKERERQTERDKQHGYAIDRFRLT